MASRGLRGSKPTICSGIGLENASVPATSAGAAVALGGIQRDIVGAMAERGIFGAALQLPATGYAFVYVVEIGLLLLTVLVMSRFIGAMRPVEAGRAGAVLKGPDRAGSIQPF